MEEQTDILKRIAQNDKDIEYLLLKLAEKNKEKKAHNIRIKNKKEPKIKPDMRFSEKQKYRLYKTKIEPNKHDKIMIDEEDDIVAKIREAFDKEKQDKYFNQNHNPENSIDNPSNDTDDKSYEEEFEIRSQDDERKRELNLSEIYDIDEKTEESLLGQIQPYTPEVQIHGQDMSMVRVEEQSPRRISKNRASSQTLSPSSLLTGATQFSPFGTNRLLQYSAGIFPRLSGSLSRQSEASGATTLFNTPSRQGARRGRPPNFRGRSLDLTEGEDSTTKKYLTRF